MHAKITTSLLSITVELQQIGCCADGWAYSSFAILTQFEA